MTTIKVTCADLKAAYHITVAKVTEQHLEVTHGGKTAIRTYYQLTNGNVELYFQNQRFVITDAFNIPEAKTKVVEVQANGQTVEVDFEPAKDDTKHAQFNTIKTCIQQNIPVYLCGEAGTGKNYTLMEISKELGLEFYFTNSVQQEYKLTGFIDAGGVYHETEFYKAFTKGGLFFLDEMDASIPEVLVLLNAAIANKYFEFPNGRVDANPNFRVVAAGNTVGSGADEMYTGRLTLDQATLDRFVIIEFDYDRNVELMLAKGNVSLVNFVRELRKSAKQQGIRATFSYRCIISVVALESAGMDLKTILKIAVFKGMNKDTIRTLKLDCSEGKSGKYYFAMQDIQKEVA
jgi:hypothetical protein